MYSPQDNKSRLDQTISSFSKDPILNRATQVRRDNDKNKVIKIGLYDIDRAIKFYIEKTIQPKVPDNDTLIPIPVIYANGEKWSNIRRLGYARDAKGKLLFPLLAIKRQSIQKRPNLERNRLVQDGNSYLFKSKYTPENRYDNFSILTNQKPLETYYIVAVPDFVEVTYQIIISCDYQTQVNEVIEQLKFFEGKAWGDTFKFNVYMPDAISTEIENQIGQDRICKATLTLKAEAFIVPKHVADQVNQKKVFSVGKIQFREPFNLTTKINTTWVQPTLTDENNNVFQGEDDNDILPEEF